jgi:hypothetical protein
MEEKTLRLEVQHLLRDLGFWDYHPPDDTPIATPAQIATIVKTLKLAPNAFGIIQNILKPPSWRRESVSLSRPDIYGLNPKGPTVIVEVKLMQPKVKIEPWIHPSLISDGQRAWLDAWCYEADGHGFLAVGTSDTPRQLFIVPWPEWVKMEKELATITFDFHIKASNIEPEYALKKVTNGWELPLYHPLLGLASEATSPNRIIGKTPAYSFRFTPKKEESNESNKTDAS